LFRLAFTFNIIFIFVLIPFVAGSSSYGKG